MPFDLTNATPDAVAAEAERAVAEADAIVAERAAKQGLEALVDEADDEIEGR